MKAARIHKFGEPLRLEDIPIPIPAAGHVLIRIIASGVCHTDLHATAGDMPGNPTLPFIPGHEIVGRVVAHGPGVTAPPEGTVVGVPSLFWACGECAYCTTGWETLCHRQLATGYTVDGGFAEYVVAPADFVAPIPPDVDPFEMAPILCAGVTTYKALKQTGAVAGDWLVISGFGGLGHVAIQYAREMGLRTGVVDVDVSKLAHATQLGAEFTVNARAEDVAAFVHREIGGAHAVLLTAASSAAFQSGVGMLRRGGVCVLVGLPTGDFRISITDMVLAGLTVRGSIIGTRHDLTEALELAALAGIRANVEKRPLEQINEIFDRLAAGQVVGRVVLDFSGA